MITRTTSAAISSQLSSDDTLTVSQSDACDVTVSILLSHGAGCYVGLAEQYADHETSRMHFMSGDSLQFTVSLPAGQRTVSVCYSGTDPKSQILAGSSLSVTATA